MSRREARIEPSGIPGPATAPRVSRRGWTPATQRNARRGEYHELLLVSAVVTVVAVRVGLHVSGYPQIAGGPLHIAHLLWGGVAMLAAVLLLLTYLSRAVMRLAAVLAGAGFGLFVDELGKFITADNNYFFRPALSLIYLCFVLLYLLWRSNRRAALLDDGERRVNEALDQEQDDTSRYLRLKRWGLSALGRPWLAACVSVIFLIQAVAYVVGLVLVIVFELSGTPKEVSPVPPVDVPIVVAGVVAAASYSALVVLGAVRMISDRLAGLLWFRRATLLNLLLVQPFHFYRDQISALSGLGLNLVAYAILLSALARVPRH